MNLLLLLSALLSALTGAVPGVRRAEVPQAMAQGMVAASAGQTTIAKAAMRPEAPVISLVSVSVAWLFRVPALIITPIWMDRRRE